MGSKELATFAGGCFWCMQPPFDQLDGVINTNVGYMGGEKQEPSYEEVCSGVTGHTEAIQVTFDADVINYDKLLDVFWQNIDPTDLGGQFADQGTQYRPEIFYYSAEQKKLAEESRNQLEKSSKFDKPIRVNITKAQIFYKAEDYHQKYYEKNATHYKMYRYGSGREGYLKEKWDNKQQ